MVALGITFGVVVGKDSVHFDESLAYETNGGRTVYGGGGIMPDYFVALDTTGRSIYVNRLSNSNSIREFTLDYRDTHPEMKEMSFEEFRAEFKVTKSMVEEVIKIGETKGIRRNPSALRKSEDFLKFLITARIARDLFDDDAFFKVYNETEEIYKIAIELFLDPAILKSEANGSLLQTR